MGNFNSETNSFNPKEKSNISNEEIQQNHKTEKSIMNNQFTASISEMDRGKTAFQSLCASILVSSTAMGFIHFFNCISAVVNKDVTVTTIREPIDFDHRMFYPILGTVVGVVSVLFLKSGLTLDTNSFAFLQIAIAAFSTIFGIYWLICKPMVGRYGKKFLLTDIIVGIAMVVTGVYLLFYSVP